MSFLSDLHSYWAATAALNNALPATSVYTGLVPEATSFPYAVIIPIALVPTPTTGNPYWATFTFQISIFDTDPDNVETLANTIGGQFDYKAITAATLSCERSNGPVFVVDQDTPQRTYHAYLEYNWLANRTLPTVG